MDHIFLEKLSEWCDNYEITFNASRELESIIELELELKDKSEDLDIAKAANAALIKESMGIMQTKDVIKLKTIADALETLDNNKLSGGGIMTERDYGYNQALMDLADYAQEI